MQGVYGFASQLAVHIGVDGIHRTRTIEGNQGGNVLKRSWPQLTQGVAHPLAFQLEHANRLAGGHQLIGRHIVEGQLLKIDARATALQMAHRPIDDGQGFQPQEVELHQSRAFHPFHVELGRRKRRARVLV